VRLLSKVVPLVRQMKGFRGYYLINGGPEVLITISVFDSADEAFASNEKAADWVRNNVLEATRGLPEVMVGDVLPRSRNLMGCPRISSWQCVVSTALMSAKLMGSVAGRRFRQTDYKNAGVPLARLTTDTAPLSNRGAFVQSNSLHAPLL
jgi:hypothetical protein